MMEKIKNASIFSYALILLSILTFDGNFTSINHLEKSVKNGIHNDSFNQGFSLKKHPFILPRSRNRKLIIIFNYKNLIPIEKERNYFFYFQDFKEKISENENKTWRECWSCPSQPNSFRYPNSFTPIYKYHFRMMVCSGMYFAIAKANDYLQENSEADTKGRILKSLSVRLVDFTKKGNSFEFIKTKYSDTFFNNIANIEDEMEKILKVETQKISRRNQKLETKLKGIRLGKVRSLSESVGGVRGKNDINKKKKKKSENDKTNTQQNSQKELSKLINNDKFKKLEKKNQSKYSEKKMPNERALDGSEDYLMSQIYDGRFDEQLLTAREEHSGRNPNAAFKKEIAQLKDQGVTGVNEIFSGNYGAVLKEIFLKQIRLLYLRHDSSLSANSSKNLAHSKRQSKRKLTNSPYKSEGLTVFEIQATYQEKKISTFLGLEYSNRKADNSPFPYFVGTGIKFSQNKENKNLFSGSPLKDDLNFYMAHRYGKEKEDFCKAIKTALKHHFESILLKRSFSVNIEKNCKNPQKKIDQPKPKPKLWIEASVELIKEVDEPKPKLWIEASVELIKEVDEPKPKLWIEASVELIKEVDEPKPKLWIEASVELIKEVDEPKPKLWIEASVELIKEVDEPKPKLWIEASVELIKEVDEPKPKLWIEASVELIKEVDEPKPKLWIEASVELIKEVDEPKPKLWIEASVELIKEVDEPKPKLWIEASVELIKEVDEPKPKLWIEASVELIKEVDEPKPKLWIEASVELIKEVDEPKLHNFPPFGPILNCKTLLELIKLSPNDQYLDGLQNVFILLKFLKITHFIEYFCDSPKVPCKESTVSKESAEIFVIKLKEVKIVEISFIYLDFETRPSKISLCYNFNLRMAEILSTKLNCFWSNIILQTSQKSESDKDQRDENVVIAQLEVVDKFGKDFSDLLKLLAIYLETSLSVENVKQMFWLIPKGPEEIFEAEFKAKRTKILDKITKWNQKWFPGDDSLIYWIKDLNFASKDKALLYLYVTLKEEKETVIYPTTIFVEIIQIPFHLLLTLKIGQSVYEISIPQFWNFSVLFGKELSKEAMHYHAENEKEEILREFSIDIGILMNLIIELAKKEPESEIPKTFMLLKIKYLLSSYGKSIHEWIIQNLKSEFSDKQIEEFPPDGLNNQLKPIFLKDRRLLSILKKQNIGFVENVILVHYFMALNGFFDVKVLEFFFEKENSFPPQDQGKDIPQFCLNLRSETDRILGSKKIEIEEEDEEEDTKDWTITWKSIIRTKEADKRLPPEKKVEEYMEFLVSYLLALSKKQQIKELKAMFQPIGNLIFSNLETESLKLSNIFFRIRFFDYGSDYSNAFHLILESTHYEAEFITFGGSGLSAFHQIANSVGELINKEALRNSLMETQPTIYINDKEKLEKIIGNYLKGKEAVNFCVEISAENVELKTKMLKKWILFSKKHNPNPKQDETKPVIDKPDAEVTCVPDQEKDWASFSFIELNEVKEATDSKRTSPRSFLLRILSKNGDKDRDGKCKAVYYEQMINEKYSFDYTKEIVDMLDKGLEHLTKSTKETQKNLQTRTNRVLAQKGAKSSLLSSFGVDSGSQSENSAINKPVPTFIERLQRFEDWLSKELKSESMNREPLIIRIYSDK